MHMVSRRTLYIAQDHRSAAERGLPLSFSGSPDIVLSHKRLSRATGMSAVGPQAPRIFFISVDGGERYGQCIRSPKGHCTSPKTVGQRVERGFPLSFFKFSEVNRHLFLSVDTVFQQHAGHKGIRKHITNANKYFLYFEEIFSSDHSRKRTYVSNNTFCRNKCQMNRFPCSCLVLEC